MLFTSSTVTAFLAMGGIKSQVFLYQLGSFVRVSYHFDDPAQWQIHELPVDFTIDPKLRCKPEYVGKALPYSGNDDHYIPEVTTAIFIMHSIVISVNNEPVACGTIVPLSLSYSLVRIDFKMGLIGKIFIAQWPCKYTYTSDFLSMHPISLSVVIMCCGCMHSTLH